MLVFLRLLLELRIHLIFLHMEESEIVDIVQTLIVNKASGDDQISHRICQSIDSKQHTCMIFCDISEA